LGSSRHRGRCGDAVTNAYRDANSNRYTNRDSEANDYGHANAHCYTNSHSNGYG